MLFKESLQDWTMNKTPCFSWLPVNMWHPVILQVKELQKPGTSYEPDSDGLKPYSTHTSNSSTYFFLLNSWLIYWSHSLAATIAELLSEISPSQGKLVSKPRGKSTTETHSQTHAAYGPCLARNLRSSEVLKAWLGKQVTIQDWYIHVHSSIYSN